MNNDTDSNVVKEYFDSDSIKYVNTRYPEKANNCSQQSYLTRKSYVLEMIDMAARDDTTILDIGCGPGIYTADLLDRGFDVYGIDISPNMIELATKSIENHQNKVNAQLNVGVPTELKFADNFFDIIICIGVISYIADIDQALKEIDRVLKPGGTVIFQGSNKYSPFEIEHAVRKAILKNLPEFIFKEKNEIPFKMHSYDLGKFVTLTKKHEWSLLDSKYYDFFVPVLAKLFPSWMLRTSIKMDKFARSKVIGRLGASFVVAFKKEQ
jgi:ubiquinone/menaquinone biosynthesis C-methylase UbiE